MFLPSSLYTATYWSVCIGTNKSQIQHGRQVREAEVDEVKIETFKIGFKERRCIVISITKA